MRLLLAIMSLALTSFVGQGFSQEPASQPSEIPEPVSLADVDYQIKLCKQYIDEYKNQAYLFDEHAQTLLSHDYLGYRDAESMSQQAQAIADDLTKHLQKLEKQRAEMVQRQAQNQKAVSK